MVLMDLLQAERNLQYFQIPSEWELFLFPHQFPSWLLSLGATAIMSCASLPQFCWCESEGRGVAKWLKEHISTGSGFLLFMLVSVQIYIKIYCCFLLCQNISLLNPWQNQQLIMAEFLSTPITSCWDYSILVDTPQITQVWEQSFHHLNCSGTSSKLWNGNVGFPSKKRPFLTMSSPDKERDTNVAQHHVHSLHDKLECHSLLLKCCQLDLKEMLTWGVTAPLLSLAVTTYRVIRTGGQCFTEKSLGLERAMPDWKGEWRLHRGRAKVAPEQSRGTQPS